MTSAERDPSHPGFSSITSQGLHKRILFHLRYTRCKDLRTATDYDKLVSLCLAVRDLAMDGMITTQRAYLDHDVKRIYYLSMEFLIGRLLQQNMLALGILERARHAVERMGIGLDRLLEIEADAGLGNGGLGRLAACYLDSLATHEYPAYGYGLRYEHGMFRQEFMDGWQIELPDDWLKYGTAWEMVRPEYTVPVMVYGRVEQVPTRQGATRPVWVDWQMFEGVPHDVPVIGYGVNTVNILRLWSSRATQAFRLDVFNTGDYIKAVEEKNWAETITKVLYPSENTSAGKELRLLQEYFLSCCSVRDIIRRFLKNHSSWDIFPEKNAIQLNDTHPVLAIVELMRYFVDEALLPWDRAWDLTVRTFGFTNHTLLPEALEKWPVPMFERILPRHLQIIYSINERFLNRVSLHAPGDGALMQRMSLIEESLPKQVRMANLAIIGSHHVNGVSRLHSDLIRTRLVPDFAGFQPGQFLNVTNGITSRLWLRQCNPALADLITQSIGDGWVRNAEELRRLETFADDATFRRAFHRAKRHNKERLAERIQRQIGLTVDPDSLFDVQVKRLHEYKRQLLNVLHIIALYHRIQDNPGLSMTPRTFVFAAKAAPGYYMAKLIVKLINTVADRINHDALVRDRLKVVFLPDYCVSLAEVIIPAANLSEQISTAGTEASGTGNMKMAINGALTIGTWDGANIEIAEAVGRENVFIFGHTAEAIEDIRRAQSHRPTDILERDRSLARVIDAIRTNAFAPGKPDLFRDIGKVLVEYGDHYLHLADYPDYLATQDRAAELYRDTAAWDRQAILNVARMGGFSSDRSVREYADLIWNVKPLHIEMPAEVLENLPRD